MSVKRIKTLAMLSGILLLFSAVSCREGNGSKVTGRHAVVALMDSAELIMNDNPERACQLMDSIDSHSIRSRALQARYALLYTESRYKNYIDETNDSLIMIAVRYYSIGNDYLSRFRSYYSLGCIYNGLHRYTDAAVVLSEAERLESYIDDGYRLGLLYMQLGNVYNKSYDDIRAERYYQKAADCYLLAEKDRHRIYALYYLADCRINAHDFESADSILRVVQEWAHLNQDNYLYKNSLIGRLSCSIFNNQVDSSSTFINRYIESFGEPDNNCETLGLMAHYYIQAKDYPTAWSYIQKAWKCPSSASDSINLFYLNSLYYENKGLQEDAIKNHKQYTSLQNDKLRSILKQPVLGAQKDHFRTLAENETLKVTRNRLVILLLIVFIACFSIILYVISHIRKERIEKERQDYLLTIKELRLKEDTNNEIIDQLSSKVNALFSRQYAELDLVFEKMMETTDKIELQSTVKDEGKRESLYYKRLDEFYRHIKDKFDEITSDDSQRELDNIINSSCNGLMKRLADEGLNLSSQELLILRLSVTGFSPKTISRLTGTQSKTVYQQRSRTLQKIAAKSETLAAEIRKLLK